MKRSAPLKRTPLRPSAKGLERTAELARGPTPRRRAPLRATGKPSRRFAAKRDRPYCEWIRTQPCAVSGWITGADARFPTAPTAAAWLMIFGAKECGAPTECAHVRTRAAGGVDLGNVVSLCRRHHRQQHAIGIKSFQRLYGVDLAAVAATLAVRYQEEHHE